MNGLNSILPEYNTKFLGKNVETFKIFLGGSSELFILTKGLVSMVE